MPAWLQPLFMVPQISPNDLWVYPIWWLLMSMGALVRINGTIPFWRPLALAAAAIGSVRIIGFVWLIFGLGGAFSRAEAPWWVSTVWIGGLWALTIPLEGLFARALPGLTAKFTELQARVKANTDKVFRGDNYPGKPLQFSDPEPGSVR